MAAMGISWEGTTCIYIVPSGEKVNADSFIKLILAKMVRHDFPRLCGERAIWTALLRTLSTVQWWKKPKAKWIPKLHRMENSRDLAPMDCAVNANFKRVLKKSRARTTTKLARLIQKEWTKIGVKTCRKALLCWRFRVQTMLEKRGSHTE